MGAIRVHEFISLDNVIDTPSWTFPFGFDPRMGEAIGQITTSSDGILLGRTTYEMFEPVWSRRTAEEDPGAPFFNDTSKYVVSSTLTTATWRNTEIIGGYDPKRIQQLKESAQGLYVSGSGPWSAPSWLTGWSTSCTCSCIRSPVRPGRGCSTRACSPPRGIGPKRSSTTTA